jgi:nucleoside-diphosphate-sugar epimerase
MASICVIGGTRFFGKIIVRALAAQGHAVTILTRGRSGDDFGDSVNRLKADANDAAQMRAALSGKSFDVVLHQMCYSPIAARIACDAFAGRVGHLIMTSTIEVYNPETFEGNKAPSLSAFAREDEMDAKAHGFDERLPWLDAAFAGPRYAEGKRQAESVLAQNAAFPLAFVRVGHVLSDRDEFTGRLSFHVRRILEKRPITSWPSPGKSSFVSAETIADFLVSACSSRFTGAINACAPDGLSVRDLCAVIETISGQRALIEETADPRGDEALSPFSFPRDYRMSNARAAELGYRFAPTSDWLPQMVERLVEAERKSCST